MPEYSTRTRSFDGCDTCRLRHVRCDTTRPSCLRCTRIGLLCGGYEKNAVFQLASVQDQTNARFRRPISTEAEQQRMSDSLRSSLKFGQALRHVREIEQGCEDVALTEELNISRGPFNVFRANASQSREPFDGQLQETAAIPLTTSSEQLPGHLDPSLPVFGQSSPATQTVIAATDGQAESFDVLCSDHWTPSPALGRFGDLFDLDTCLSDVATSPVMLHPSTDSFPDSIPPSHPTQLYDTPNQSNVPSDAVRLLSHYITTVVSLLTPFRHTKTPWHILFIPFVKNCLAATALNEQLDHASLCVFHGTLTLAAMSLGGLSIDNYWAERSGAHKEQALQHARLMLQTAYTIPKTAKYKTILMALVTMIQVSLFSGTEAEPWFLEAEKLIRLKGLGRRKSRRIRLLHHCYVFERLFHESTTITASDQTRRQALTRAVVASGIVLVGQDTPDFRYPDMTNLESTLQRLKGQEEGENDLHLASPGDFPATMYPEVVAIPEAYMALLSLIVRLGKAKDAAENMPQHFLSQAKSLERAILRSEPLTHNNCTGNSNPLPDERVLSDMRLAMHEALLLYFYRRVYDIDASLLQTRARRICEGLLRCEAADPQSLYGSTGFRWPAFIAACETEEVDVQESFTLMFRRLTQRSGLVIFSQTLQVIQEVWHEKRHSNAASVSWVDVLRMRVQHKD